MKALCVLKSAWLDHRARSFLQKITWPETEQNGKVSALLNILTEDHFNTKNFLLLKCTILTIWKTECKSERWVKALGSVLVFLMKEKRSPYSELLMQTIISKLLCELWNKCPFLCSSTVVDSFLCSANSLPISLVKNEASLFWDKIFPVYFKVWNVFKPLTGLLNLNIFSRIFFWQV